MNCSRGPHGAEDVAKDEPGDVCDGIILAVLRSLATLHKKNSMTAKSLVLQAKMTVFWSFLVEISSSLLDNDHESPVQVLLGCILKQNENGIEHDAIDWLPLHCAALCHDIDEHLIHAIFCNVSDTHGCIDKLYDFVESKRTPFHYAAACRSPNMAMIRYMQRLCPRMTSISCAAGMLPVHYASKYSNSVTMLAELVHDNPATVLAMDSRQHLPITYAYENTALESYDMMEMLITSFPECLQRQNDVSHPLEIVLRSRHKDPSKILLLVKASVKDIDGDTMCNLFASLRSHPEFLLQMFHSCPELSKVYCERSKRTTLHLFCKHLDEKSVIAVEIVKVLLELYPEAAAIKDSCGSLPLHVLCARQPICHNYFHHLVNEIIHAYPDGVFVKDYIEYLPVHWAVYYRNTEAARAICQTFPECVKGKVKYPQEGRDDSELNIFHFCAATFNVLTYAAIDIDIYVPENIIILLCDVYPEGLSEVDSEGNTFLHRFIANFQPIEYFGRPEFWVTRHLDTLRVILRTCPDATTTMNISGDTPYAIARRIYQDQRFIRTILQTTPDLDKPELYRLNYEARRVALFMFFSAIHKEGKHTIFSLLSQCAYREVYLRYVVQYL